MRIAVRGLPPPLGMRRIRPVVRSETSASPFGRNAMPHGTCKPVAIVVVRGAAVESSAPEPHAAGVASPRSRTDISRMTLTVRFARIDENYVEDRRLVPAPIRCRAC
jgi:hypothetical protein